MNTAAESFYDGALGRIRRLMIVIGLAATLAVWARFGRQASAGLALGCAIAFVNFYWLKRIVTAFADRITQPDVEGRPPPSPRGMVARFLLRYLLVGLAAYAIFSVSHASLNGLLAGLFLPVAAIFCEAAYEVAVALRRGV